MRHIITHELTDSDHFIEARRLPFVTDVMENCHCALWVLWKQDYDFCHDEADIPVSTDTFREKADAFQSMTQSERTKARLFVADGLYEDTGVDFPCCVCGFQAEEQNEEIA